MITRCFYYIFRYILTSSLRIKEFYHLLLSFKEILKNVCFTNRMEFFKNVIFLIASTDFKILFNFKKFFNCLFFNYKKIFQLFIFCRFSYKFDSYVLIVYNIIVKKYFKICKGN